MIILKIILYILLGVIAFLLAYVLLIVISAYAVPEKLYDEDSRYYRFLLNSAVFLTDLFLNIHVHVSGMEKVPENTRFLLVANHLSKFDPLISWFVFRRFHIAYISKPENFRVPAFGRIIRKCCFMPIDRETPAEASKTLKRAEKLIKDDVVSIGVYPEGTRGDGQSLGAFHNGMFHIARATGAPIVVTAIRGTQNIHRNIPWHRTDVYLDVVDVISNEFYTNNNTRGIGSRIFDDLNTIYPVT